MITNVDIWLDTSAYDKYASSRRSSGVSGTLEDAIAHIDETITIISYDAEHSTNDIRQNLAHIGGTTDKRLATLTVALYSNDNVKSRIRRLKTDTDLLDLSSKPQEHVPTEEEIAARRISTHSYTCNDPLCTAAGCPVHG